MAATERIEMNPEVILKPGHPRRKDPLRTNPRKPGEVGWNRHLLDAFPRLTRKISERRLLTRRGCSLGGELVSSFYWQTFGAMKRASSWRAKIAASRSFAVLAMSVLIVVADGDISRRGRRSGDRPCGS